MVALCKVEAGTGGIALRDPSVGDPGPGEMCVRMGAAGVCGTDIQIYNWAPRMARRMTLPRVLGHEASGVVEAVGEGVANVAVGDHVSLESHIFCGVCRPCRIGRAHLCESTRYPGIDVDGAFAERFVVPAAIAWVNPPDLPHETAALLEPLGIAVHAATEGSGVSGQVVVVSGCGPIGLMTVAVARALGAETVVAVDVNPLRLACAERLGADRTVNPADRDVAAAVMDMTGGYGADVAIEYSGNPAGFRAALDGLCKGGDFRLVGAPSHPTEIDLTRWLLRCPRVINIHGRRIWKDWDTSTRLLRGGRIDLKPVVSHVLPLSEGHRAFDLILSGQALKPILVPDR